MKKTKIVCTVGPASYLRGTLGKMYRAGMNGARINTAYGTLDQHRRVISSIRKAADIPMIIDVKGPEIRLIAGGKKPVKRGDVLEVGRDKVLRFNNNIYDSLKIGDDVRIDNGRLRMQVVGKRTGSVRLRPTTSGEIGNGKGVNLPNKKLAVPTLSQRDREIIDLVRKAMWSSSLFHSPETRRT